MLLKIDISNRAMVFLFAFAMAFGGLLLASAYNDNYDSPAAGGAELGHSADEVIVRMNDGSLRTAQELLSSLGGNPSTEGGINAFCNSVNTGPLDPWTGYGTISMLINGRNICEDISGCTLRVWAKSGAEPAGMNAYNNSPVMFRQYSLPYPDGSNAWHEAANNYQGNNGDGVNVRIIDWANMELRDDIPNTGGAENSSDALSWRDTSTGASFIITLCDY